MVGVATVARFRGIEEPVRVTRFIEFMVASAIAVVAAIAGQF
jgi:hypothetical protein